MTASEFWSWFRVNARTLRRVDNDRDNVLEALRVRLAAYDADLFPELSVGSDGTCEFIVTAGGEADRFASAETLVGAAPPVAGWLFTALKPPAGFEFELDYESVPFDPGAMRFDPLEACGGGSVANAAPAVAVRVYVPNFDEAGADRAVRAVRVILYTGLGERSYAADLGDVEVAPMPDGPAADDALPLTDLPAYIAFAKRKGASRAERK